LHHSIRYIWQRSSWPAFRWNSDALLKRLGQSRFNQGLLLMKMKDLGFDTQQQARADVLVEETIKNSEIEGEHLDPNAVRSSVARRLGLPTSGIVVRENQHADGAVQILLDATTGYQRGLTPERLFSWHAALFPTGYSGLSKIRVANWRDDADGKMKVVSGPIGREKIHYEAPPAERLENEMQHFLHWWEESRHKMDGILRAGMGHLWFVAVHPFADGNGRIARTLTETALAQDENLATRYYSLSSQIMAHREDYYRILEHTTTGDGDITDWLMWFLECVNNAVRASSKLLSNVMLKTRFWRRYHQKELKKRQRKVLNRLLDAGPGGFEGGLTNRKYAGIAHISRATAQRDLSDLVSKGILRTNPGGGRSAGYDLCWETFTDVDGDQACS